MLGCSIKGLEGQWVSHLPSPQNKSRRGKASPKTSRARNGPSQIASNIQLHHRFRFVSTNATPTAVTARSLLFASGGICTIANSFLSPIYASCKIGLIEMWSPPASQGASATCSVDWSGFANSPNREVSDTTVSVATPAHLVTQPPSMSLAKFWQQDSTTTLFTLVAPVGTIIDVTLQLILNDGDAVSAQSQAVTTGTLGVLYYLSLDPNATHRYTPVSLTTTT